MSLRRLGVDCIDLFQLHRVDPLVPAEEQFGLLAELKAEGKVKSVGLSEVDVATIEQARGIVEISTVQNLYNIGNRSSEAVLDYCEANGIGFIPWFPVGGGSYAKPGGELDAIATELGASTAQVALAWLLQRSEVMLPIPGTGSLAHLEENCAAASLTLSDAQLVTLNALAS
jgi:aryl-alcohol dehydrogenase-like predicted oxidoreductase